MKGVGMMRLFLTVNMSDSVRDEIGQGIPDIHSHIGKGKWVPKENLHITMLFLGEVERGKLSIIEEVMEEAVDGMKPFHLVVEGLGTFPNPKRPNILWAGVKGDLNDLNRLYQQTIQAIDKTELPFDAKPRYTPHITLARKIEKWFTEEINLKTSQWEVSALELYESMFSSDGVKYRRVLTKKFTNEE